MPISPPEIKEPVKIQIEYSIQSESSAMKYSPIALEHETSLSSHLSKGIDSISRACLNESITFPSRLSIITQKFKDVYKIYNELKFSDTEILITALNIIDRCTVNNKLDVIVSKTGDNELLIYRKNKGEFSNIVIDEDGDISYLFVGTKIGMERTEYFPKKNGFDYSKLATML